MGEQKNVYFVDIDCGRHESEDEQLVVLADNIVEAHRKAVQYVNDRQQREEDPEDKCSWDITKVELVGAVDVE